MNSMLKIGLWAFVLLVMFSMFRSCTTSNNSYGNSFNVSITTSSNEDAASGLDLRSVGELVKKAKTGEEFEQMLNTQSIGVNNLDLDEDGTVDYIKVTEYGAGDLRGFSLTVDLAGGQTQEIATIEIEKTADGQAHVQTRGNQSMYGSNHYYHSRFGLTDALLLAWLFNGNRSYYSSPWGYNNYPGYYGRHQPRSYDNYRRHTRDMAPRANWTSANRSTLSTNTSSPNSGKSANNIKAPLKQPTTSQKSFQARNPSKQVRSGGFGRKTSTTSSPTVRKSTSSSYRGGGK